MFRFVRVDLSEELRHVLAAARDGATLAELVRLLASTGHEPEEANAFVDQLTEFQILVPESTPAIWTSDPCRRLRNLVPELEAASAQLANLDAKGLGTPAHLYERVVQDLSSLPTPPERDRLFHIDLYKPAKDLSLSSQVCDELLRASAVLALLRPAKNRQDRALDEFIRRFTERYEQEEVPLLEALDEESGIGFGLAFDVVQERGRILERFNGARTAVDEPTDAEKVILGVLTSPRELEWALSDADIKTLTQSPGATLPPAFSVHASVARAAGTDNFAIRLISVSGPSGAQLLTRFCFGDPELASMVTDHMNREEALYPDATVAELLHFPEGRTGNILSRPVMRKAAISYLANSPSAEEIIRADDLLVTVRLGRIRLRSRSSGREIIPRLTCAHNFGRAHLAVYRFLATLGSEGVVGSFPWGRLGSAPFRPRVRSGRTVLDIATWNLGRQELAQALLDNQGTRRLRDRWLLPRWITMADGDRLLPFDLESEFSRKHLAGLIRRRETVMLQEMWPVREDLIVEGPDGKYANEVIVPFLRKGPLPRSARATISNRPSPEPAAQAPRILAPGSNCLYLKLYGGPKALDRFLRTQAHQVLSGCEERGASSWFFLRYTDPSPHLRIRLFGDPTSLYPLHEARLPTG